MGNYSIIYWLGSTRNFYGFRTESIRRILYKNTTPPGHYMTSKDGEFVQWYKREWTDYDAVKTTKQVYQLLKKRWKQLFTGN
jgi:hypothetical protein